MLITPVPEGIEINPHETEVFCEIKSVVRSEFFAAYGVGPVSYTHLHKNINTTKDNHGNYNRNKAKEAHRKYVR